MTVIELGIQALEKAELGMERAWYHGPYIGAMSCKKCGAIVSAETRGPMGEGMRGSGRFFYVAGAGSFSSRDEVRCAGCMPK